MVTLVPGTPPTIHCRVCGGPVAEFLDLGSQPLSDGFLRPSEITGEFFFRLAVGRCEECSMVQLVEEVPRNKMFHQDYPYVSSGSSVMRRHFARTAEEIVHNEGLDHSSFFVEIGSNDGILLSNVHDLGVRHLGFEPSTGVAEVSRTQGVRVRAEFFEEETAARVREVEGPADVIYAANTFCHIPYVDSVFRGVDAMLSDDGVFVFEDPYWGDIVQKTAFDQIYDEHFFFFSAGSVQRMASRFGMELVDVSRLPVHGGEVRYTLARAGARRPSTAVVELIAEEWELKLAEPETASLFAKRVGEIRDELIECLVALRAQGSTVAAYGATAKSATVANFCGIGPEQVSYVCDTTPAKQGRLTPGSHIPVKPPELFANPYPDYALLFAWNHANEILKKEKRFREDGGRWILYVPSVRVV